MSYTRLAAVAAVLFLSVSACSKSEDQAEAVVEASGLCTSRHALPGRQPSTDAR
jgi:hypothetical protein